jgi:ethanolamine utilization protein EutQ (cupin superfamily)
MHRLAHWAEPERGDIVVCLSPEDGVRLVKRVVGKPGDVIFIPKGSAIEFGTPTEVRFLYVAHPANWADC